MMRTATTLLLIASMCALAAADALPPTAAVQTGAFALRVVADARIAARRSVTIASDLPSNTAKIAWLVEDGAMVAAGEPVVRFDPEPFQETASKAEGEFQSARAALLQAQSELQIQLQHNADQDEAYAHQIELATLALTSFDAADAPLRLASAANEVHAAKSALAQARQEAETQRLLAADGLGSAADQQRAAARAREGEAALQFAERRSELLESVQLPRERREAELTLQRNRREREAAAHTAQHQIAKQQAMIMALQSRAAAAADEFKRAQARLDRTAIRAPVAGFAIRVATSVGNGFRKVQVGDSVWHRHGFIVIPDMSALVAEVQVRELDVGRVSAGQPVALQPEAYPRLALAGAVETVGTLAEVAGADDGNYFAVRIAVDGVDARLRPGMRARAEIVTKRYESISRVPVEAVFRDAGATVCYVWRGDRQERREVTLGDSDGVDVVVIDGLKKGEYVLLDRPRGAAE